MDLNKLFKVLAEKGLYYIEVGTNSEHYFSAYASTGYNGRGSAIEVMIDDTINIKVNNIEIRLLHVDKEVEEIKNLSEEEAFIIINNFTPNP